MKKKSPVKGFKVKPKKKTYTKKAGTKPTGKYTKKAGTLSSPGSVVKDSPEMRKRKIDKLKADPRFNVRLGKKAPMKITAKQKANLPANLVKEIKAKEASGMKMKKAAMKLKKESAMMLKKSAMEMKKASAMKMKMKKSAATMKKAAMKMKMKRK